MLKVRTFEPARYPHNVTERDGTYETVTRKIPLSKSALILMDVWADHPNQGHQIRINENVRAQLSRLVGAARKAGLTIIHSSNQRKIHKSVKPQKHELVLAGENCKKQLIDFLGKQNIKYLLYAGYDSNICVLTRPSGICEMKKCGFENIFVRDASLAFEAPEFLDEETAHKAAVYMIELNWGSSTTVNDVLAALRGANV